MRSFIIYARLVLQVLSFMFCIYVSFYISESVAIAPLSCYPEVCLILVIVPVLVYTIVSDAILEVAEGSLSRNSTSPVSI